MGNRTITMAILALTLFFSNSITEFERYKDARLRALYGENYYQYVYFVDEIRYNGIAFDI